MENEVVQSISTAGCVRALSDIGPEVEGNSLPSPVDDPIWPQPQQSRQNSEILNSRTFLSPGSSCSDALEGLSLLPSRLNSQALSSEYLAEDGPELNVDSVHEFIGSSRYHMAGGVPKPNILAHVSGTGLAPWEIHRPQKFVRDLILRRCFSGRVLDSGCGIGDNALFVAKAAVPGTKVVAVDVAPRCLEFAAAKAGLRNMRGKVDLLVGDMLESDPNRLPPTLGSTEDGSFAIVLDSLTFHCFSDTDRERYVATLGRLLRPGGLIYMNCMSEEETRPGGPRRITVADLHSVFCTPKGWEVEGIEDSIIEFHPTFWGGTAKSRLYTIRKLS